MGNFSAETGFSAAMNLMEQDRDIDSFFCENDLEAFGVLNALQRLGFSVPGQIKVMGFDDIPVCELVEPTLTTVHSFKETLGREAVGLLHRRITQGFSPAQVQAAGAIKLSFSTRIVPRDSVAQRPVRSN